MKKNTFLKNLLLGLVLALPLACQKEPALVPATATKTSDQKAAGVVQITIVPSSRYESSSIKESSSLFICPTHTILTGRYHKGDENGYTKYEYATLVAMDAQGPVAGTITVENLVWGNWFKESSGQGFNAPVGRVIVGREHRGDENGNTRYLTAEVKFNGNPTSLTNVLTSGRIKESSGIYFKTNGQAIIGRIHQGDENGYTYYQSATIVCSYATPDPVQFRVVVKLHPNENYFPMDPMEFIRLSRFRHHVGWGSDEGYSKYTGQWSSTNAHDPEYYDIPVSTINNYGLLPDGKNRRPRDDNQGDWNVFLEPDDNLAGVNSPTGVVPAFQYATNDGRKQFWLFYGYNYSQAVLSFSHQGDWESVTLQTSGNTITGAWLSAHGNDRFYSRSELEVHENGNVQTLVVYSAKGSHALYTTTGSFHTIFNLDDTANGGHEWVITDKVADLEAQPWRDYAGAWGEVGETKTTTGPLGPWFKRIK